jgi:hypothetical protein
MAPKTLALLAAQGQAWISNDRGLAIGQMGPAEASLQGHACWMYSHLTANSADVEEFLRDPRRLAGQHGGAEAAGVAAVDLRGPIAPADFNRAKYRRAWDGSLYLCEVRQQTF